ncbi:peptidase s1 pa clan [Lucifera butyrica]|uniref:Peptidase s1 pa clan n=1 Tax=Lucifera butyrica TaxID=1351585 RepID=A0A498R9T1_9FIRM|nr:hypothetical protein [Lucifera butyrica]VBB08294.1 peptidase s1 pa clan [Lucifera butyrica]
MHIRSTTDLFRNMEEQEDIIGVGYGNKWTRGEDTGQKAIVVLVEKKRKTGDLRNPVPKRIDGMVTDVLEVGNIRLFNEEHTKRLRPAQPGISIGHYKVSAGTFGAVVRDQATGEKLILSNNHVLANLTNGLDERSKVGDPILQPGMYDGGNKEDCTLGHLKRFIPVAREMIAPHCRIARSFEQVLNRCIRLFKPHYRVQVLRKNPQINMVDCAVASPIDAADILEDILEIGPVCGIKEPYVGMPIKKSGRSSGITSGNVLATDVTLKVNVRHNEYGIFTDQILAGAMSAPGDSGSLILSEDNFAVGLLFAGSEQATMFNRIDNVLTALNIMF